MLLEVTIAKTIVIRIAVEYMVILVKILIISMIVMLMRGRRDGRAEARGGPGDKRTTGPGDQKNTIKRDNPCQQKGSSDNCTEHLPECTGQHSLAESLALTTLISHQKAPQGSASHRHENHPAPEFLQADSSTRSKHKRGRARATADLSTSTRNSHSMKKMASSGTCSRLELEGARSTADRLIFRLFQTRQAAANTGMTCQNCVAQSGPLLLLKSEHSMPPAEPRQPPEATVPMVLNMRSNFPFRETRCHEGIVDGAEKGSQLRPL